MKESAHVTLHLDPGATDWTYAEIDWNHIHESTFNTTWRAVMRQLPSCYPKQGPWIAGGCVRRFLMQESPWKADINYFCADKQQFNITCAKLETIDAQLILETKDHKTYRFKYTVHSPMTQEVTPLTIQVIRSRYKPTLQEHMNEFDFTICQTGWDGQTFHVSLAALQDLEHNTLRTTGRHHSPVGSYMRVLKYHKQGFRPSVECLMNLIEACVNEVSESSYSDTESSVISTADSDSPLGAGIP